MANIYPDLENIKRLKVPPTSGEWDLINYLVKDLDETYEIFFNPYLDGDRPDIIILKEHCCAYIIEVKDWSLKKYKVDKKNKWRVKHNEKHSVINSPHAQVFRYKKNLYDLHLPVLGLSKIGNKNFFKLVNCYIYFYGSQKKDIEEIYSSALDEINKEQAIINKAYQNKNISFDEYDNKSKFWDKKKRAIERDKYISFTSDSKGVNNLFKKIKEKSTKHILFDNRVYDDFKRRLSPSEETLKQGMSIKLDKKQLKLTESKSIKEKIKGVAGCGKTSIMVRRAINANNRHNETVLILTFNITLKNLIRDKISKLSGKRDFKAFEISNYHQFFMSQLNNTEQNFQDLVEEYGIKELFYIDLFNDKTVIKYNSIFIDEIQDYESEWVKIIRDNFLQPEGEMVLFGDEAQNIYKRNTERASVIAQGFGRWQKLNRSYRISTGSRLNQLFKDFQKSFFVDKYSDLDIFETSATQISMSFNILKYEIIDEINWNQLIFNHIQSYIRMHNLHPNDVVVLGSNISLLMQISDMWCNQEKTHCMFETFKELSDETNQEALDLRKKAKDGTLNKVIKEFEQQVNEIRRSKKNHFYSNSGLLKFSTIHSFKGLEEKTVFYVMTEDDSPELIYTSITRSTENLVVFDIGTKNKCSDFLKSEIKN